MVQNFFETVDSEDPNQVFKRFYIIEPSYLDLYLNDKNKRNSRRGLN